MSVSPSATFGFWGIWLSFDEIVQAFAKETAISRCLATIKVFIHRSIRGKLRVNSPRNGGLAGAALVPLEVWKQVIDEVDLELYNWRLDVYDWLGREELDVIVPNLEDRHGWCAECFSPASSVPIRNVLRQRDDDPPLWHDTMSSAICSCDICTSVVIAHAPGLDCPSHLAYDVERSFLKPRGLAIACVIDTVSKGTLCGVTLVAQGPHEGLSSQRTDEEALAGHLDEMLTDDTFGHSQSRDELYRLHTGLASASCCDAAIPERQKAAFTSALIDLFREFPSVSPLASPTEMRMYEELERIEEEAAETASAPDAASEWHPGGPDWEYDDEQRCFRLADRECFTSSSSPSPKGSSDIDEDELLGYEVVGWIPETPPRRCSPPPLTKPSPWQQSVDTSLGLAILSLCRFHRAIKSDSPPCPDEGQVPDYSKLGSVGPPGSGPWRCSFDLDEFRRLDEASLRLDQWVHPGDEPPPLRYRAKTYRWQTMLAGPGPGYYFD